MIGLRKEWNRKQYLLQKSFFAYSLFTAAQFLRRWFSALTQTVTQTRKNQVELSVLETTKLRNFLSRKVRKCLEMSAKNIRPTFGTKRPRVRIPTLRPPNQKPAIVEIAGFSLYINAISPFSGCQKGKTVFTFWHGFIAP